ncbi:MULTISPECIES: PE-PPE domain-containing protein [unclassified Mycolicibacterium]|uniref:PE-PPE domain-containing protein n=1 Tax=unclassified Mycolicibacterium TaxID=2636767 RepID=UPI001390F40A|nr:MULTISPECIES: PE-PPE domain-containing protein [unclassified Mycolicibacterium]
MALTLVALIGTVGLVLTASMTTLVQLAATALIMGGTGMKVLGDPHQWGSGSYVDQVNDTYLAARHLHEDDLKWVSTPEQFWPSTGLSDISFDTSVARGVLSLNNAIQTTSGDKVVVGYSQSANIATREKRNLAELRAQGATVPSADQLSFVFVANPNRPNGGILARFEGLYIPILGVSFDGATPDDEYKTIDVARQYDLIADFPKYPLNLLADLNALAGYVYLHPNYGSSVVNLNDPSTYQSHTSGNTTYYLVHTEHLPLLQPLRDMGIPAPILDLAEPTLRVLIELAYDRTPENMGVPTRAGLIPHIDVNKLGSDLAAAAKEGVHNALRDLGIHTGDTEGHTEAPATLAKSAPEKSAVDALAPAPSRPGRTGLHLADARPDTDTLTRDADVPQPDRGAQGPKVKSDTTPMSDQIRKSLRQSLLHKKPSGDTKTDASQGGPRPRGDVHHTDESDPAQPKSDTKETKDGDTQVKPRRNHGAGHSDATKGRASVERAG